MHKFTHRVILYIDKYHHFGYYLEGTVHFEFKARNLLLLYTEEKDAHRYPPDVVEGFFEVMAIIDNAKNESDIRAFKYLHFEKLRGSRAGQHSLKLNKQFRLIVKIEEDEHGKLLWIIEIVDYH